MGFGILTDQCREGHCPLQNGNFYNNLEIKVLKTVLNIGIRYKNLHFLLQGIHRLFYPDNFTEMTLFVQFQSKYFPMLDVEISSSLSKKKCSYFIEKCKSLFFFIYYFQICYYTGRLRGLGPYQASSLVTRLKLIQVSTIRNE